MAEKNSLGLSKGDSLRKLKRRLCGAEVSVPVPLFRAHFAFTIYPGMADGGEE